MTLVARRSDAGGDAGAEALLWGITGLICGENIDPAAPCYIKGADGKIWMSNATAVNEAAKLDGWSSRPALAGQPLTLYGIDYRIGYAVAGTFTPGQELYMAATAGRLDTAAAAGRATPIARAITDTDIRTTTAT